MDMRQSRKAPSDAVLKRAREAWGEPFVDFTVYDLLHAKGSPLDALLNAHLFWPQFVTLDDMTFLPFVVEDEKDKERVRQRLQSLSDKSRVEKEFNCIEVASLFGPRRGETSVEEDEMLAEYLVEMWAAKLRADFPRKQFFVALVDAAEDLEVAVTLHEQR
jgi:hypothetical protein